MFAAMIASIIISATVVSGVSISDPCTTYSPVYMYDGDRGTNNRVSSDDDFLLCDSIEGHDDSVWYRFDHEAGTRLPEKCIDMWRCGTQAPIWLNGRHPTDGAVVTRQVCASFGLDNCCGWNATVDIKRCNDVTSGGLYFVYKLPSPPGCPLAYCVDDIRPETTPTTTTPSGVTVPPTSQHEWSKWSKCSKPCDYGLMTRHRTCERLPCDPKDSIEYRLCSEFNCPEQDSMKKSGLVVYMKSSSNKPVMENVVVNEKRTMDYWRRALNELCNRDMSLCCGHDIRSGGLPRKTQVVTKSDFRISSGYPRFDDNLTVRTKFTAKFKDDVYEQFCDPSSKRGSESPKRVHYISVAALRAAVTESEKALKNELNLIVTVTHDAAEQRGGDNTSPSMDTIWLIVVGVMCIIIIAVLVVVVVVLCKRHRAHQKVTDSPPVATKRGDDCLVASAPDEPPTYDEIHFYDDAKSTGKR